MFILGNIILTIANIIDILLTLYILVIIAHVILSWVPHNPYHPVIRFIHQVTEPVLYRVRTIIPPIAGLDLSPMIIIFLIYIVQGFLVSNLTAIAYALK